MKGLIFTFLYDDRNMPIFVGDILRCTDGYDVIVYKDNDGNYFGKLICSENDPAKDIPCDLNKGKSFTVIKCNGL